MPHAKHPTPRAPPREKLPFGVSMILEQFEARVRGMPVGLYDDVQSAANAYDVACCRIRSGGGPGGDLPLNAPYLHQPHTPCVCNQAGSEQVRSTAMQGLVPEVVLAHPIDARPDVCRLRRAAPFLRAGTPATVLVFVVLHSMAWSATRWPWARRRIGLVHAWASCHYEDARRHLHHLLVSRQALEARGCSKGLRGVTGCFVRVIGPHCVAETIEADATTAFCSTVAAQLRAGTLHTAEGSCQAMRAGWDMPHRSEYMVRHLHGAMCRTMGEHAGGNEFLSMGQGCSRAHVAMLREVCGDVQGWNRMVRHHIPRHPWMDWRHVAYVVCMCTSGLPHLRQFLHALAQGAS